MSTNAKQGMPLRSPVSTWIEAFNTRNLEAIVELYTDDAELFDAGMRRPRHGKQEIASWFRLRFASMPENAYLPQHEAIMQEERAVVPWALLGQGPRLLGQAWLSHPFQITGVSYFTLHTGRIHRQYGIYDHIAVLRQLLPFLRWLPGPVLRSIYYIYLWRHGQL